jgi:hypothetical protein
MPILLVDSGTRQASEINIPELKRFSVDIISELREISTLKYLDEPLVVLEGFMQAGGGYDALVLYKELLGVDIVYIGSNRALLRHMSGIARTYSADVSVVGYSLILAAVSVDSEAFKPFSVEPVDRYGSIARVIVENPGLVDPQLREMASAIVNLDQINAHLYREVDTLKIELSNADSVSRNQGQQLKLLTGVLDDLFKQTLDVKDALRQYSFLCQRDVYRKVDLSSYRNRPNILYFKEFGDFLHLPSFVRTVAETMKAQFDAPTKVLWIVDKHNPMRQKYVPHYYSMFADGVYTKVAAHTSEYMCTTGGYDAIIRSLCENQSLSQYLIIVDSKLADDIVLPAADIVRFDLCRSASMIPAFNLLDERTVLNNDAGRRLSWDHYPEYGALSDEDRFLFLANRPVITDVIQTIQHELLNG